MTDKFSELKITKRGKKFTEYEHPDDPSKRIRKITLHDQYYLDGGDWKEVVESFSEKTDKEIYCSAERMNTVVRVLKSGARRWYPNRDRDSFIEFGMPEFDTTKGSVFNPIISQKSITSKHALLSGDGIEIDIEPRWNGMKTNFVLGYKGVPTRFSIPVVLHNLTYKDGLLYDEDKVVGVLLPSVAWDSEGFGLDCSSQYIDGKIIVEVDDVIRLPDIKDRQAKYPITVDPDFVSETSDRDARISSSNPTNMFSTIQNFAYDSSGSVIMFGHHHISGGGSY